VICDPRDVAVVPFPFSERPGTKRRPALVVSSREFNRSSGHTVMAMITTRSEPAWPGDVAIRDLGSSGLPRPCLVRLKLFTLDNRLLLRRAGRLGAEDEARVKRSLAAHVSWTAPAPRKSIRD
jgi:mRNA interferase MazF